MWWSTGGRVRVYPVGATATVMSKPVNFSRGPKNPGRSERAWVRICDKQKGGRGVVEFEIIIEERQG